MIHHVDNSPTASARVAMAQIDRLRRADLSATNKVAKGDASGESAKSAVLRLDKTPDSDGAVPGLMFVASPGQLYEVECFGGFVKAPPVLGLDLPSGSMSMRQSSVNECTEFRAVVAIGEKGGEVTLTSKGGALLPGLFFMRATAL